MGAILIGVRIKRFGEHFELGLMFGTLYAQLGLAALLASWGLGSLGQRISASLGLLALAIGVIFAQAFNRDLFPVLLGITLSALVQYLLMAGFYALLRLRYGLRLQHHTSPTRTFAPSDRQFGIGQLMILMTAVGVCLAFVRAILSWGVIDMVVKYDREIPIFLFLSVVAMLALGLLSIALLLQRSLAIVAVPLMLVFIVALTYFELQLMRAFLIGPGPDEWHFVWINTISVVWTMFYILLIRATGYQLAAPPLEPKG